MTKLRINKQLPLGLAWLWVKYSFATFREKPINFIMFGVVFVVFSLVPFLGALLSVLVLARIYFSIAKVDEHQVLGLKLNLGEIIRQRNLVNLGVFNMFFDLILMSAFRESLAALQIDPSNPLMLADHRVLLLLGAFSIFRVIFFGIALVISCFNPKISLLAALRLNWQFVFHNAALLILSLVMLLPFVLIPVYVSSLLALSISNVVLFAVAAFLMVLCMLLFLIITTIFSYKLYKDGTTTYE